MVHIQAHSKMQFSGYVVKGFGNGRKMGFPTANIQTQISIDDGVYIGEAKLDFHESELPAIVCIGTSQTFGHTTKTYEVHILHDFGDKEFYGSFATITLHNKLRDNAKFSNIESLKQQLVNDKNSALNFFEHKK